MRPTLAFVALVCFCATYASNEEVAELNADAATSREGVGGYFSALQTSGSFTMMQAGGFEEEESVAQKKLGEARGSLVPRASAPRQVKQLPPGQDPIAKALTNPGSAGGGACAPYGTLKCTETATATNGQSNSLCKDEEISSNMMYWMVGETGGSRCVDFKGGAALTRSTISSKIVTGKTIVMQKPFVAHPHNADTGVGVFGLKRVACTGGGDGQQLSCETFKVAWCVSCSSETGFAGFASKKQGSFTADDGKKFIQKCAINAFHKIGAEKGQIKREYACSDKNQAYSQFFIMTV